MDEKQADNKVLTNKDEIDRIDDNIASSKEVLKNLNYIEDCFISLNKNLTKCIELLNSSMKGKESATILDRANETKNVSIKNSFSSIDSCREKEENKIKNYNEQKDDLEFKNKQKLDTENDNNA